MKDSNVNLIPSKYGQVRKIVWDVAWRWRHFMYSANQIKWKSKKK